MSEVVNGATAADRLRAAKQRQQQPSHVPQHPAPAAAAAPPPVGPPFRSGTNGQQSAGPPVSSASATAGAVPNLSELPGQLPVAWEEIERLRGEVAARLAAEDEAVVSDAARQERARSVITSVVAAWSQQRSQRHGLLSPQAEAAVKQAVFDAHFRAGPLQRFLDMEGVEEIWVDGCHQVVVDCGGRPRQRFPALMTREDDLIDFINRLAKSSGYGERRLSDASPVAHFRLPDNSRAVATLRPLSSRTTLTIRVHGMRKAGLPELRAWGSVSEAMRQFLMHAVLANKTMIVVGAVGAGKTTLVRGLARVVPAAETIVTLESDRELFLDEDQFDPEIATQGAHVLAFEERRSNGEDGVGEITIGDLIPHALRMGARRIVVGEVRDRAAADMLKATSAGGLGALSTLHAISPEATFPRLEQLCLEAGLTVDAARSLISTSVHFIVYMHQEVLPVRRRWVSHIWEISPGEHGPARQPIFAPDPEQGEERGVPGHPGTSLPSCLPDLVKVGFNPGWLKPEFGQWDRRPA